MISKQSSKYPIYNRPYFGSYIGCHRGTFRETCYHYSEDLFREHDIFNLFVLDGGAFFFSLEHIGGATGTDFLKAFHSGKLFGPWIEGETVNWNEATKALINGKNQFGENYGWLCRLYFLLPFAHQFFLTGEAEWAERWFRHFESWYRQGNVPACSAWKEKKRIWIDYVRRRFKDFLKPVLSHSIKHYFKAKKEPTDIGWRDMQLSWRLLVFIHSVFLLGNYRSLKEKNWHLIYQCIEDHAQRILMEAEGEMKLSLGKGNHFLHKGVALLSAGILYPEIEKSQEYINLGRKIVDFHISNETTRDGANIESSPSYSHFIARLHLDVKLLLEANEQPEIPGLSNIVNQQYNFLNQTATPSGLSLPINDSYHLDAAHDISIVSGLTPTLELKPKSSCFFPDTSFAVIRHDRYTLFVDGAAGSLSHHHQGKPNIILYRDRFPVLIDPGCCNYDRKEARSWYSSSEAHNVVIVEPVQGHFTGEYKGLGVVKIFDFDSKHDMKSISMIREITTGPVQYLWKRKVRVDDKTIEISDRINSKKKMNNIILFHFAPSSKITLGSNGITHIVNPSWKLAMRQVVSNEYTIKCGDVYALSESNKELTSSELRTITEGDNVQIQTTICFE